MKVIRLLLLVVLAAVPFAIFLRNPTGSYFKSMPGGSSFFYFFTGLTWCSLFAYNCYTASSWRELKGLLWMSPLALFAFGLPGFIVWFYTAIFVGGLRGVAPP
jgi:hypothetical protein